MRVSPLARFLVAASLVIGIVLDSACGPASPPLPNEPAYCSGPVTRDLDAGPLLGGMPPRELTLGSGDGATFSPWSDGTTATVVMGFQGGAMIMPSIRVTARATDGDTMCLHVALANTLSDASEVFSGISADLTFTRVGDVFEAANIFDQLGFDAGALRGKTLMLVVTVDGVTFTATSAVTLLLG